MPAEPDRLAIHAYVSRDCHTAFRDFCDEEGISVSGLLESIGIDLALGVELFDAEMVKRARKIDAGRRRRVTR